MPRVLFPFYLAKPIPFFILAPGSTLSVNSKPKVLIGEKSASQVSSVEYFLGTLIYFQSISLSDTLTFVQVIYTGEKPINKAAHGSS